MRACRQMAVSMWTAKTALGLLRARPISVSLAILDLTAPITAARDPQ